MVTAQELMEKISIITSTSLPTVRKIAGELRKKSLLAVSGRGASAAEMSPHDAANLFMAIMGASSYSKAPEAVFKLAPMVIDGEDNYGFADDLGEDFTFGAVLELIFSDTELAGSIESLTICKSYPAAAIAIRFRDSVVVNRFAPKEGYKLENGLDYRPHLRIESVLDGFVLEDINRRLNYETRGVIEG